MDDNGVVPHASIFHKGPAGWIPKFHSTSQALIRQVTHHDVSAKDETSLLQRLPARQILDITRRSG
jgi:hypothetical protein